MMKLVTESSQILWNSFIFSQQSTGWAAKAAQDDNSDFSFEYNLGIHNQINGKKKKIKIIMHIGIHMMLNC